MAEVMKGVADISEDRRTPNSVRGRDTGPLFDEEGTELQTPAEMKSMLEERGYDEGKIQDTMDQYNAKYKRVAESAEKLRSEQLTKESEASAREGVLSAEQVKQRIGIDEKMAGKSSDLGVNVDRFKERQTELIDKRAQLEDAQQTIQSLGGTGVQKAWRFMFGSKELKTARADVARLKQEISDLDASMSGIDELLQSSSDTKAGDTERYGATKRREAEERRKRVTSQSSQIGKGKF
ncbi:MAG: hypothetical protein Q8P30_03005 [Candidatus Uhrbacteria bacterium]|nr:hypothetical protein [Candidatus Uhrbacteria bacterium]